MSISAQSTLAIRHPLRVYLKQTMASSRSLCAAAGVLPGDRLVRPLALATDHASAWHWPRRLAGPWAGCSTPIVERHSRGHRARSPSHRSKQTGTGSFLSAQGADGASPLHPNDTGLHFWPLGQRAHIQSNAVSLCG